MEKCGNILNDAKGSQERLLRDCQKIVQKVKESYDRTLVEDLKEVMATLSEATQKLSNALLWKQIDGGMETKNVNKFVDSIGSDTEKTNEKIERIKATLKARGLI